MIVRELSCDSFAGLTDCKLKLENGMNIIVGPNESGKSTMADLMYHMFFKDIIIDGRRDKDFKDVYFPKSTGTYQGDTIDGRIRFETEDGIYKLTKEWSGKDGICRLTLPDGTTIRDAAAVNKILSEKLLYGKGIYDELIFSSQKRVKTLLAGIFNSMESETVGELSALITRAVKETGGIAIDKMEAKLDKIIAEYGGRWDFETNMPEGGRKRGINNKWKVGAGAILNAYYAMEQAAVEYKNAEDSEKRVEVINADLALKKSERESVIKKQNEFMQVRAMLSEYRNIETLIASMLREQSEMEAALSAWQPAANQLEKAKMLRIQYSQARDKELYDDVNALEKEREEIQRELKKLGSVDAADIRETERLQKSCDRLYAKLSGLNLLAKIDKAAGTELTVTSEISGKELSQSQEGFEITEAVKISVPGIIDIQLMPKGIDADEIKEQIKNSETRISEIYKKYDAHSLDDIIKRADSIRQLTQECNMFETRITAKLGGCDWETIKQTAKNVPADLQGADIIEKEIKSLCSTTPIDGFITVREEKIREYEEKYKSENELKKRLDTLKENIEKHKSKLNKISEIPDKFSGIDDPDEYDDSLKAQAELAERELEMVRGQLSAAERELPPKSAEEYLDEYEKLKSDFEEKKTECAHWLHIREVFTKLKNNIKANPMEDVEEYFRNNLSLISGGGILLEEIDEHLTSKLVSKNHPLTYAILSEGTKDTISLALRLAILRHLYPDGGCFAVFDDPFTDMDPERTEMACGLLSEFSKNNQVIFITCDNKYCDMLEGNIITMDI